MKYIIFLVVCYFALESNAGVAPFIEPCVWSDDACVLASAKKALPYFQKGIPEFGVPAASPITLSEVIADNEELKLTFKNLNIVGLEKSQLLKVKRDAAKSTISVVVETPITVTGQYILGGKLAVLDVQGEGDMEIKTDKVQLSLLAHLESIEKNGQKYYTLKKFDYTYIPIERFYIKLNNLFNGDQKKAEPLLEILNHSWKELIGQIGKPVIDAIINKEFAEMDKFFVNIPVSEIEKTP